MDKTRIVEHIAMHDPAWRKAVGGYRAFCPFLGFNDDHETVMSFPSYFNCCFHAKPNVTVSLAHQREYCLSVNYLTCSTYNSAEINPLPLQLQEEKTRVFNWNIWVLVTAILAVLFIGLISAVALGMINFPGLTRVTASQIRTPDVGIFYATETYVFLSSIVTQTQAPPPVTIINTPTPERKSVSVTASPRWTTVPTTIKTTITPIEIAKRTLETPFGKTLQFIIHRVLQGESYNLLSRVYNTSPESIQAINYQLPEILWVDSIIIIPYNTSNVSGVPAFSAYQVMQEGGITIEQLADYLFVDIGLLKKYNALPDGYVLEVGEWLLIPH